MSRNVRLSDHCIIDHFDKTVPRPKEHVTPRGLLLAPMFLIDRLGHFTGLRGALWRTLGVGRNTKNPNICNL